MRIGYDIRTLNKLYHNLMCAYVAKTLSDHMY